MNKVIVNIGNKTYNCQLAKTEEEHRKELMDLNIWLQMKEIALGTLIESPSQSCK